MRKKIGAHGNFHHANIFFLPGNVAGNGIGADVQNLGIQVRELLPARIEFRDLGGSGRSPIQGMESDHDALFAKIVAQAEFELVLAGDCRQREVGCGITCFESHLSPFFFDFPV
jgi:hypothetical protein